MKPDLLTSKLDVVALSVSKSYDNFIILVDNCTNMIPVYNKMILKQQQRIRIVTAWGRPFLPHDLLAQE
jgi:hypothetical protein